MFHVKHTCFPFPSHVPDESPPHTARVISLPSHHTPVIPRAVLRRSLLTRRTRHALRLSASPLFPSPTAQADLPFASPMHASCFPLLRLALIPLPCPFDPCKKAVALKFRATAFSLMDCSFSFQNSLRLFYSASLSLFACSSWQCSQSPAQPMKGVGSLPWRL